VRSVGYVLGLGSHSDGHSTDRTHGEAPGGIPILLDISPWSWKGIARTHLGHHRVPCHAVPGVCTEERFWCELQAHLWHVPISAFTCSPRPSRSGTHSSHQLVQPRGRSRPGSFTTHLSFSDGWWTLVENIAGVWQITVRTW